MKNIDRLDIAIWVMLYGGLLVASLGLFVLRQDSHDGNLLGGALALIGIAGAGIGVVLIYVRSRIDETPLEH
jgi:hypothetical protein